MAVSPTRPTNGQGRGARIASPVPHPPFNPCGQIGTPPFRYLIVWLCSRTGSTARSGRYGGVTQGPCRVDTEGDVCAEVTGFEAALCPKTRIELVLRRATFVAVIDGG
jgi:hypothetical protein